MKRSYLYGVIFVSLMATACDDSNSEKNSTPAIKESSKKEESKTSISISKDSVGITTKKGNKVEVSKEGGSVENKDAKVKVKSDG